MDQIFDAVISTHNIEHCNDRRRTLSAMLGSVKPGGRLFMSFPCERSIDFPSRERCLNYFDDPTHKGLPPSFDDLISDIKREGFRVSEAIRNHRPVVDRLRGFVNEPASRRQGRRLKGIWEYYGFESIIWAERPRHEF